MTLHNDWAVAAEYDRYIGRWSRPVAQEFVAWLAAAAHLAWLDVGCGTGALSDVIRTHCTPRVLLGLDRSFPFVAGARAGMEPEPTGFIVADGCELPVRPARLDFAVSGLVLNFVGEPGRMIAEMVRLVRPSGQVGVYVWDYAGRMELLRYFWDAAAALDPAARELDEGRRFPLCRPEPLRDLFESCGLAEVAVRAIDVPTVFRDFADYWLPFLGGQGPAPGYVSSLGEHARSALRESLRRRLPHGPDGSIRLVARAWAARGRRTVERLDPHDVAGGSGA